VGLVDAALGHRAVVLTLRNCGSGTLTINGYPEIAVLDAARKTVKLTVQHGSSYMARDPGTQRIRLAKGEEVLSVVAWSNTVTDGDTTNGTYLAVAPAKGEPTANWPVFTDLGTTGKVELTAWCTKLPS
jgi:hypothetical protein